MALLLESECIVWGGGDAGTGIQTVYAWPTKAARRSAVQYTRREGVSGGKVEDRNSRGDWRVTGRAGGVVDRDLAQACREVRRQVRLLGWQVHGRGTVRPAE